ncbi:hypothetical protein PC116_g31535 [Phytophthora cactorum]|nr:hypothetical protein PC116_g31535 [Phytophthora cactorum]
MLFASVVAAMGAGVAFPLMTIVFGQLVGAIASTRADLNAEGSKEHYTQLINEYVFVLGYVATVSYYPPKMTTCDADMA